MISEKFEDIISKKATQLSQEELLQLQAYCSSRSFSLQQWVDVSITLFKTNADQCYQVLSFLDRHQLSKSAYNDYIHQVSKITIYNNLTGLVLTRAARQSSKEQAQKLINQAKKFLNSSEKVRMTVDKSIILNRAFLHYYGGQITKAHNFVSRTHEQILKTGQGKHLLVTTTLMLAQINFIKKNYQKSLQLYKKCLEINKTLPTKARLGMAYSFFYLAKYEMARACFQRILKLDPNCVEAYLGIAVVQDKEENFPQYFKALTSAYKINKEHPLTLLHLAEHLLFKNQLQKALEICQSGLASLQKYPKFHKIEQNCRNDYDELKARFNNLIGQIHHMNSNFTDAIKYYTLASGKGLVYNQISLAQSYLNPSSQNYLESMRLLDEVSKMFQGKDGRIISDAYRLMGYLKSKIPPKNKDDKGAEFYYGQALKFNRRDFQSKIEYAGILVETCKVKALRQLEQAEKIQLSTHGYVKPELQNNIAVLELENGEPESSEKRLQRCIRSVQSMICDTEEDELRKNSLKIITRFNYAISLERQIKWYSAKLVYQEILTLNKYHLDTLARLAYTQFQLGNIQRIKELFQQGERHCQQNKYKILRPQKLLVAKAYLQHLCGNTGAKQTLKQLGKVKDLYVQVFQLCINYQNIMRKGVQLSTLKQFLRPNREFCYKYCSEDHHATFGYMLLAIILLVDKKFTKSQGIQFFNNLKQFSSDQIPSILYNMGLFLSNYDDYESSNSVLALFKEKVGINNKADQLLSLNYLVENNFAQSQRLVKKNILRDPSNLKHRMQLAYVVERKCLNYYETTQKKELKKVLPYLQNLKTIEKIHEHLSKISVADYIRGIQINQTKDRMRNLYTKIKNGSQERKLYIRSYSESFETTSKAIYVKESELFQAAKKKQQRQRALQKERQLQKLLQDGEESQDEEQKERKQKERKKQRALQLAKKRQIQMQIAWNELKEKEKEFDEVKKSKKRNTSNKPAGQRPRRQKPKEESQSPLPSLPDEEQSQVSAELSQSQPEPEPEVRKKHKHEKKEKKRKRQKDVSSQNDGSEDYNQRPEKKREDENGDDDDLLKNYMA